jgi:ubiquinone/menaquinone biosynthesis C-methylase UbiE
MADQSLADTIRNRVLTGYYSDVYQSYLFEKDIQGAGIRYFEKSLENFWVKEIPNRVLEVGGGSGEHLPYIQYVPGVSYTSIDIRDKANDDHIKKLSDQFVKKLSFVVGNAQRLPFPDLYFDRVFSTCLLHHVDDVLAVLLEAKRVTIQGGEIAFICPTDPGLLNQLIKRLFSYPKLRKLTKIRPELFYALDHKNHVGSILELIRFVFSEDQLKFHYRPFRVKSWNLNLLVVAKITKS